MRKSLHSQPIQQYLLIQMIFILAQIRVIMVGYNNNAPNDKLIHDLFIRAGMHTTRPALYDYAAATVALNLPAAVDGAAFTKGSETRYILWAKTKTDQSEVASANYAFPTSLNFASLATKQWNYSSTGTIQTIAGTSLTLSGDPIMITGSTIATGIIPTATNSDWFSIYPNPANESFTIPETYSEPLSVIVYDMQGRVLQQIQMSGESSSTILLGNLTAGMYQVEVRSDKEGSATKKLVVY
jgi:hypothetical protein